MWCGSLCRSWRPGVGGLGCGYLEIECGGGGGGGGLLLSKLLLSHERLNVRVDAAESCLFLGDQCAGLTLGCHQRVSGGGRLILLALE